MDVKNKKFVVIGLGETGYYTALFLLKKGASVFITEAVKNKKTLEKAALLSGMGAKTEVGIHTEEFIKEADIIITSPGVPEKSLPLVFAKRQKIQVISEIELAYMFSPSQKIIAVTGTNGKTTTASILGLLFKNAKLPSIVCGNIGNAFIGEMEHIDKNTYVILEASSFQIENIKTFRPAIGCLLNIAPDHIDRHFSFKNYIEAKKKMFINQQETDAAIVNYDNIFCRDVARALKAKTFFFSQRCTLKQGAYLKGDKIICIIDKNKMVFNTRGIRITGKGNKENIMASIIAGSLCKIDTEIIQNTLYEFRPLPHRFEKVAVKKDVIFINDSKSTNPHSVINALRSIEKGSKAILIMGGQNKQMSFTNLVPWIKKYVKLLILLGEAKETIASEVQNAGVPYIFVKNMKEAVQKGASIAQKGDIVLLSPGCASFDMFNNYKERGNVFKKEVELLL